MAGGHTWLGDKRLVVVNDEEDLGNSMKAGVARQRGFTMMPNPLLAVDRDLRLGALYEGNVGNARD